LGGILKNPVNLVYFPRRIMAIATGQVKSVLPKTEGLVEMNWDPITRIVGSLGIFT